jgi:hypothetical protein
LASLHVFAEFTTTGRMKYVRPLYRALYKTGPTGQKLAVETFLKHKYGLANAMMEFLAACHLATHLRGLVAIQERKM